ncbi:proton-conducting transporter transmembrane domain-containing protein [Amnibacterium sp.]|uniref:proton-conducting transporter transmembrane domain-containing protein n=1 Tax=Amnibacterium sp. TaxID=1872496 RepID=UPI003F7C64A4
MTLALGLAALLLAVLLGWIAAPDTAPSDGPRGSTAWTIGSWIASAVGSVLMVVDGAIALASPTATPVPLGDPLGVDAFRVDQLSGLFLVIVFGVAAPAALAGAARTRVRRRRAGAAAALVLLASALVVTAGNLFVLYAGWEGIGLAFYLAVGYDRRLAGRGSASVLAAAFSKLSGVALLLGGLLVADPAHGFSLQSMSAAPRGLAHDLAYALLVFAFAVKVGLVPVHIWLPRAYAAAPPAVRAILAGSAVNAGFYGMWRTLDLLHAPPQWSTALLLVLAGVTALLGISHAAVNGRLPAFVAWSSVENAGLILGGYGVALVGASLHDVRLTAAGLLAATAQVCTHAVGKSLLFVAVAGLEDASATDDLDRLRAVVHRVPWSGTALLVGALTLAGVPLTAGFASEWLLLESMMQEFRLHVLGLNLAIAVGGALTALTIGFASIAFVRLIGLTVFGPTAGTEMASTSAERSPASRAGMLLLAAGCVGAAMLAPLEVGLIAAGLRPLVGTTTSAAVQGWILQPVFGGFSALSPSLLWIVLPAYTLLIGAAAAVVSRGRLLRVRRVPAWTSGSPGVRDGRGYTSFAFVNPVRKVLAGVLLTRHQVRRLHGEQAEQEQGVGGVSLGYTVDVVDVVERFLYRPLIPAAQAVVRAAKRLQSGRLDAYVAYMLIAVLAVIAVVALVPARH